MPSSSRQRPFSVLALVLALALATGLPAAFAKTDPAPISVDIPYEQFTLPNGLRVVVHTDRKAPIVAVNVWYHVGSKDETRGPLGFRAPVRAPDVPGFGKPSRANSSRPSSRSASPTRTAPPTPTAPIISRTCRPPRSTWRCSWNRIAWATCSARSTRPTLDEQRGVVQNEKRQGENQPYGRSYERARAKRSIPQAIPTTTP